MSRITPDYAVKCLSRGELVALPTETVYGLAGRIDMEETLRQIFTTKDRPFFDPLIVHVADASAVRPLVKTWPKIYDVLVEAFWPGPMTLVAPKSENVSSLITSGLDSVALRCPRHPLTEKILKDLKVPVAAPSANRFGHTSPTSADHVEAEFSGQVSVVDGGDCEIGVESTVLSAREGQKGQWIVEILRPGGISRKQIRDVLQKAKVSAVIERAESRVAPGHLKHHYQPSSPLALVPSEMQDSEVAQRYSDVGILKIQWVTLDNDPKMAARALYQLFHDLSAPGVGLAFRVEPFHHGEDWEAVWDRLNRAATYHWVTP